MLGVHPNSLRYAAPTGTVALRWEGAKQPIIWTIPAPEIEPRDARLELARRYLHVYGPTTASAFAQWAGIGHTDAGSAFQGLGRSLIPVRTPIGDAWILGRDEAGFRTTSGPVATARLLPSGDSYYLLHGDDRALLIADEVQRQSLWTSRVWPGALLVGGEIVGTWRRSTNRVSIQVWRNLSHSEEALVEAEAASLPLPGTHQQIDVSWQG